MKKERLIIYAKDIQRITGKTDRYGRYLLQRIKLHFKKDDNQFVSVEEFCEFTGLKIEQVMGHLFK